MEHHAPGIAGLFSRWLARETRGLLGGLAGGVAGSLMAFAFINRFSTRSTLENTDAVSIANTYIVYSTLVIGAVAIVLTAAGLIFTQHFAVDKERNVENAFNALVAEMGRTNGCAVEVVREVMKNPEVVEYFEDQVKAKLNEVMRARMDRADQQKVQALNERESLSRIASDLENV